MIVRLTNRQATRVGGLAEAALAQEGNSFRIAAFNDWWDRDTSVASKHRVDLSLPAAGWRMIEAVMFDHCFDERGFRTKDVKTTDLNALKTIRRALNARKNHPALQQMGAIGMIPEVVPAWKLLAQDDHDRLYLPYPMRGMKFVILAPESTTVRTKQTTLWVEAPLETRFPLLDEREHWRFMETI